MDQDWDAVADAITKRLHELGMRQRDLADKADVGLSTVQELASNWKPRRRNSKVLAAISEALGWPPGKLAAIARGEEETAPESVEERLSKVEAAIVEILNRLDHR